MPQIDAIEFYTTFRRTWALQIQKLYGKRKTEMKDKQWTDLVLGRFLKPLGESFGYQVIREKGGRVDERWQEKGRDIVAIEHENWGEDIGYTMQDVRKLISLEAPLKVAITYVGRNKMDYFIRAWTKAILLELKKKAANWQLLLILSSGWVVSYKSDWFGILFQPTYEARPLFYSANAFEGKDEIVNRWVRKEPE